MDFRQKGLKLLSDLIGFQTVAADPKRYKEILRAVDFLTKELKKEGLQVEVLKLKNASPLIIASKFISKSAKTIAIYAHYDVQPEDPVDEWKTPPFKLTVKNGKFFARGAADDKSHLVQIILAFEKLLKDNKLVNNLIFIFEGEEEVGSRNFEDYMIKAKKLLSKAEVFYLIDVGMHKKNIPQIFYGLRGLVYFEIILEIGKRDLHSGIYGNLVLDPTLVLSTLFSKIKDVNSGKIIIPHFYDKVRKLNDKELALLDKVKVSPEDLAKEADVNIVLSTDGKPEHLSTKIFPSFDINGVVAGYTGQGAKTVIPKKIISKFSFRLVENQDPDEIEKLVTSFIKKNIPKGVKYGLKTLAKFSPFYTKVDDKYIRSTADILKEIFKNGTLLNRTGGSVPASEILQRLFQKPVILTGFTLPDEKIHSPNENMDEEMFWMGIKALEKIYSQ